MGEKMDFEKKKAMSPEFRVSYPNVFAAKAFGEGEAKFGLTMLISEKVDITMLRKAAFNAAVEAWGPKEKWPKNLKFPFRKGNDDKPDVAEYKDKWFIACTARKKPTVIGNVKDDDGQFPRLETEAEFYAGCYARATVVASAYGHTPDSLKFTKGNKGVKFTLLNVQKLRDGERLGGGRAPEQEFDEVPTGENDAENYETEDETNDMGF